MFESIYVLESEDKRRILMTNLNRRIHGNIKCNAGVETPYVKNNVFKLNTCYIMMNLPISLNNIETFYR